MRDHQHDYQQGESDLLETMTAASSGLARDSPTSEVDAGLDDAALEQAMGDLPSPPLESDIDALDVPPIREIPVTDLQAELGGPGLQAPELSDLNVPGEIDIEALDEDDLEDTDLPADARLDPLED